MQTALWEFAELEGVYQRLKPRTPYGRQAIDRREILTDAADLERRYDCIEAMLLLTSDPAVADRFSHHLQRIPLLPDLTGPGTGAELFLVRKFLIHCRALATLLGDKAPRQFGLKWESDELLAKLDTGGGEQETFFLADHCSPELAAARKEIRELDATLQGLRRATLETLRAGWGLDFEHRDFLVIDTGRGAGLSPKDVFLEPFDSGHVIVRPMLPRKHFELLAAREGLLARECELENVILAGLGAVVSGHSERLRAHVQAIEALDVALAGAELARSLRLVRPRLLEGGGGTKIVGGRLVPLEESCIRQGLTYRPLSVCFQTPHVLLHGSNMSGKSVVLKTAVSLQMLAQLGLFVPAEAYETIVFDQMSFIGAPASGEARGLSSFGQEMVALRRALASRGRASLFVIDEFARTTNSIEAVALIAGLMRFFDATRQTWSLLATHYAELPVFDNVRAYCMKGLDWDRVGAELQEHPTSDLEERIHLINRFVPYEMIPDDGTEPSRDAIGIAQMLGLDEAIVEYARRHVRDATADQE